MLRSEDSEFTFPGKMHAEFFNESAQPEPFMLTIGNEENQEIKVASDHSFFFAPSDFRAFENSPDLRLVARPCDHNDWLQLWVLTHRNLDYCNHLFNSNCIKQNRLPASDIRPRRRIKTFLPLSMPRFAASQFEIIKEEVMRHGYAEEACIRMLKVLKGIFDKAGVTGIQDENYGISCQNQGVYFFIEGTQNAWKMTIYGKFCETIKSIFAKSSPIELSISAAYNDRIVDALAAALHHETDGCNFDDGGLALCFAQKRTGQSSDCTFLVTEVERMIEIHAQNLRIDDKRVCMLNIAGNFNREQSAGLVKPFMSWLSAQKFDFRICNLCMVDGAKSSGLGELLKIILSDNHIPTVFIGSPALRSTNLQTYFRFADSDHEMTVSDALQSFGLDKEKFLSQNHCRLL